MVDPRLLTVDTDMIRRVAGRLRAIGWRVGGAVNASSPLTTDGHAGLASTAALAECAAAWERYLRTQAEEIEAHFNHLWRAAAEYDRSDERARQRAVRVW